MIQGVTKTMQKTFLKTGDRTNRIIIDIQNQLSEIKKRLETVTEINDFINLQKLCLTINQSLAKMYDEKAAVESAPTLDISIQNAIEEKLKNLGMSVR